MSHVSTQSGFVEGPIDLRVMCLVVGALALFAPFLITIDPVHDLVTITAMTWTYERVQSYSWFRFMEYVYFMAPLPTTIWRPVFVYQLVRYYRGRGTRLGTVLLGVLAETLMLGVYIVMILLSPPTITWGWSPFVVPTPLMLLAGLAFMWTTPFREPKTPFDNQVEPDRWWREKADSEGFFMFCTRLLGGVD